MSLSVHFRRDSRLTLLAAFLLLLAGSVAQEKKLTVYAIRGTASYAVFDRNGTEYVSLADVLAQFGKVSEKQSGEKYHLRFVPQTGSPLEAEFAQENTTAKIAGRKIEMARPFFLQGSAAMIPTSSLPQLMSSFLNLPVNFHQTARRLFVGPVSSTFFYELQKSAPSRLVLHFSAPVNPSIATEPGRLRMLFAKEPIVTNTPSATLSGSSFSSWSYNEANGAAEISVASASPLQASFSDGGKTITITAQPSAPATASAQTQPAAPPNLANLPVAVPAPPRFLIVIDPAHGGDDRGAAITPALNEKDVVLAFARRLRAALDSQGISVVLLRDSDTTLSFDQREAAVNSSHAALVISLHATSSSPAVHVYTALLASAPRAPFLPWDTAQAAFLDQSQSAAGAISKQLFAHNISNSSLPASLRPLSSFAHPAVAIELAPPDGKPDSLMLLSYQQPIVSAVVAGISDIRPLLENPR